MDFDVRFAGSPQQAELAGDEGPRSDELIAVAEELARVRGCLRRMKRLQRSVVTLSLVDEQPSERVAELLGISPGYVRVLLHRAREHIRTCGWEEEDETEAPTDEVV